MLRSSPLVLAALQPRVTQDPSRNGQITIEPAEGAVHSASFVGPIHGLGDSNRGWLDVAGMMHQQMPHVKFVLPNAPTSPVTLNGGMAMPSWYDITSLDDRANQPCTGIEESRAVVDALIAAEVAAGIPLDRIVVGGFSQGGAMSLYAGLQYPGRLAGVLVMSGYLAAVGYVMLDSAAVMAAGCGLLEVGCLRASPDAPQLALAMALGAALYVAQKRTLCTLTLTADPNPDPHPSPRSHPRPSP